MNLKQVVMVLLGGVIFVSVIYFLGLQNAPATELTSSPVSLNYSGVLEGKCVDCVLEGKPSSQYSGVVSGRFSGVIYYNGEKTDANLSLRGGVFSGSLVGAYEGNSFSGSLDGNYVGQADGVVFSSVRVIDVAFRLPDWLTAVIVLAGLYVLLTRTPLAAFLLRGLGGGDVISKSDAQLVRELKDFLYDEFSVKLAKVSYIEPSPIVRPIYIKFIGELEGDEECIVGEKFSILYARSRGFYGLIRDRSVADLESFRRRRVVQRTSEVPQFRRPNEGEQQ